VDKARHILSKYNGTTGAYTESNGPEFVRQAIADFIDARDEVEIRGGVKANPESIILTDGASVGVKNILNLLIAGKNDGIMIPVPQYPLYSAAIAQFGGQQIPYYLDEENGWSISLKELEQSYSNAVKNGIRPRALVVINPGNPTGSILEESTIREVIEFARQKKLSILADEVYQENVYGNRFYSFARVMGQDKDVPLFSIHSTSKGFYGECGLRGGYLEVRNAPDVQDSPMTFMQLLGKMASVCLCSNTTGQILTYLMCSYPKQGEDAHEIFAAERMGILEQLATNAGVLKEAFKQMKGVECYGHVGAMYLFPRLNLPKGMSDFDYCMALLEKTGICTVNGEGFGQKPGTLHLRIAFLPQTKELKELVPGWIEFHNNLF
jgi:aspartate/methionine/tyrosine aminotransferase